MNIPKTTVPKIRNKGYFQTRPINLGDLLIFVVAISGIGLLIIFIILFIKRFF
jgi:hypothetical protein